MSVSSNGKISKIYVCVNFHLRCKYVLHLLFAHTVLNAIIVGIIVTTVLAGWLNIPKNCRTGKAIKPMTCKQRKVLIIYLHKYSYIYLHAFSCIALASFKQIYLIKVRQVDTLHRCQCEALIWTKETSLLSPRDGHHPCTSHKNQKEPYSSHRQFERLLCDAVACHTGTYPHLQLCLRVGHCMPHASVILHFHAFLSCKFSGKFLSGLPCVCRNWLRILCTHGEVQHAKRKLAAPQEKCNSKKVCISFSYSTSVKAIFPHVLSCN